MRERRDEREALNYEFGDNRPTRFENKRHIFDATPTTLPNILRETCNLRLRKHRKSVWGRLSGRYTETMAGPTNIRA